MIKRILVGLSGTSFAFVATQRGVELAQLHEARLTGITVVDLDKMARVGPVPLGGAAYAHKLQDHLIRITREQIEESVRVFESCCAKTGVKYNIIRETGNTHDLMIAHSRYADLTIYGLRGLFDFGFVQKQQNTLIRLIGEGVRPIIAVSQQFRPIHRVLIAYNGSMESAKAMKRFVQLRPWPNVILKIICFGKEVSEANLLLNEAAHYCQDHSFQVEVEHFQGSAQEQLLPKAMAWKADLIVIGNSVRRVLIHGVVGDTTLHVIKNAEIPLFLSQ